MPALEIVSIGAPFSEDWGDYKQLRYIAIPRLVSERGIFQEELDLVDGVLVRLGKTRSKRGGGVGQSYELIDLEQVDRDIAGLRCADALRFRPEVAQDVKELMRLALRRSPSGRAIFLSDYQLGGEKKGGWELSRVRFEELLIGGHLTFNTMYLVTV